MITGIKKRLINILAIIVLRVLAPVMLFFLLKDLLGLALSIFVGMCWLIVTGFFLDRYFGVPMLLEGKLFFYKKLRSK